MIVPSGRDDEIGIAERELGAMQRDLASMLQQKSHLAALGLAVSKINHDLRNLLASAQLFSDRLASVPDPNVQRFAPKLMRSLERAIAFCQSTLSYGQVKEPPPDRRPVRARKRWSRRCARRSGLAPDSSVRWVGAVERGLRVDADPDQLFRVILNLARNALQALEARAPNDPGRDQLRVTGQREGAVVVIEVSDTGPGVTDRARAHLFEAFQGSTRPGRLRPRARDRGRAGARAWRRDPPGRRHHRGDLPHHHPGPRGRHRGAPRRAGETTPGPVTLATRWPTARAVAAASRPDQGRAATRPRGPKAGTAPGVEEGSWGCTIVDARSGLRGSLIGAARCPCDRLRHVGTTATPVRDGSVRLADGRRMAFAEWGDPAGRPVVAAPWHAWLTVALPR